MELVAWYVRENGTVGPLDKMCDGVGVWSGETLDQMRKRYPSVKVGTLDEYEVAHRDSYRRPPQRITKKEWTDALETLPPMRWVRGDQFESFCFQEPVSCHIHSIYARLGKTYWRMVDDIHECTHEAVEKAVRGAA